MTINSTLSVTASAGGITYSNPVLVNWSNSPFSPISLGVVASGTSCAYTVQHTFDEPLTSNSSVNGSATWYNHSTLTSLSSNSDGAYVAPCKGVRLKLNAATTASAVLTIIQG